MPITPGAINSRLRKGCKSYTLKGHHSTATPESYTLTTEEFQAAEDRAKHAFGLLSDPEKAREQVRNLTRYRTRPWEFLTECVFTLDQVDRQNPVKHFPAHLDYLRLLTLLWLKHLLMGIPKSRRMTASWTFISLYLQDTIFNRGRFNGLISKKEDDAADLLSRAEFIYHHIPDWRLPNALLPKIKNGKMSKSPPVMEFPEIDSKLQGFPSGADQLRQFTLSGLLGDECAFWDDAEEFYSATKPTLDGGGRMTLISSRAPGFFKKIVFDQIDSPDYNFAERAPAPVKVPIPGVEVWKNPRNGFLIVDLHYSANPKKDGNWAKRIEAEMPRRQFLREYEKSWQTFEGLPVYGDTYDKHSHLSDKLAAEAGLPLLIGWDFGLTPAAVVAQLQNKRLVILKEYVSVNESISTFAPKVYADLRLKYGDLAMGADKVFSFIDPAGFQRGQSDLRTCASYLRASGFDRVDPGPIDWEARKGAVEAWLGKLGREGACMQILERECPVLVEGFAGGYQYPEKAGEIEPTKIRPVKNRFSHPHDALQYLCHGVSGKMRKYNIDIPKPHYGFQKGS